VPGLVVVVYAGNDDNKSLGKTATGGVIAAPVWQAFVSKAVKYLTLRENFEVPEEAMVDAVTICKDSGFLSAEGCPSTVILLPSGEAPLSTCPLHGGSWIMAESDTNEPRMLLSPRDEEVLGVPAQMAGLYSISVSDMTAATALPAEEPLFYERPQAPSFAPPPAPTGAKKPTSTPTRPRERTPKEIEDRFQELLKEYGISD